MLHNGSIFKRVNYLLACLDSSRQRQNSGQSENFIAGILTLCPFEICSATANIVFTDIVMNPLLVSMAANMNYFAG